MTLPLWPQQNLGSVRRGDIFALGRHRLACIDATNKADVARLFDGRKPTLVVTSPPYINQRAYHGPIKCWTTLIVSALVDMPADAQLLVNLGIVYRNCEFYEYWQEAFLAMRKSGWRVYGNYIWHKTSTMPGQFGNRLTPAHEFVFHINKQRPTVNSWLLKKSKTAPTVMRVRTRGEMRITSRHTNSTHKKPTSVISLCPHRSSGPESSRHPAPYPCELPLYLIKSFRSQNALIYDPFAGSGTTLLACESENTKGVAAELSPAYVQLSLDRWRKAHPDKPVTRVS